MGFQLPTSTGEPAFWTINKYHPLALVMKSSKSTLGSNISFSKTLSSRWFFPNFPWKVGYVFLVSWRIITTICTWDAVWSVDCPFSARQFFWVSGRLTCHHWQRQVGHRQKWRLRNRTVASTELGQPMRKSGCHHISTQQNSQISMDIFWVMILHTALYQKPSTKPTQIPWFFLVDEFTCLQSYRHIVAVVIAISMKNWDSGKGIREDATSESYKVIQMRKTRPWNHWNHNMCCFNRNHDGAACCSHKCNQNKTKLCCSPHNWDSDHFLQPYDMLVSPDLWKGV